MPKNKATKKRNHGEISKDSDARVRKARLNSLKTLTPNIRPLRQTLPFPPEIRLKIFGNVFDRPYKIAWRPSKSKPFRKRLNILQVSSTVYQEAYEILYDTATFKFDICDTFTYGSLLENAHREIVTKITTRIRHARVILGRLNEHSARYQQAVKSTNELVRALRLNTRLRSLELVMNEDGLERLMGMETLQFLDLAVPIKIQVRGPSFYEIPTPGFLEHQRAHFDTRWRIFLREFEASNGPIEVEAVSMSEDWEGPPGFKLDFEATLRLKQVPS